ncbi:MAG: NUDIX hydrolase [Patescibacteria group bacterium]
MNKKTEFPDLNGEIHVLPDGVRPLWRPSAYVLVERNREVLMVRPHWSKVFDLAGGGIDPGETLEEGALREFLEETGRRVKLRSPVPFYLHEGNLFYRDENGSSDPVDYYWHILAYFFHGSLESEEVDEDILARHETAEVRWVPVDDIWDWENPTTDVRIRPFYREPLERGVARNLDRRGGWDDD